MTYHMTEPIRVYSASDMARLVPRVSIVETVRGRRLFLIKEHVCFLGDDVYEFVVREPDDSFRSYFLLEPNLKYVGGRLYVRSIFASAPLSGSIDSISSKELRTLCARAGL